VGAEAATLHWLSQARGGEGSSRPLREQQGRGGHGN
jgi:hypothetical protein